MKNGMCATSSIEHHYFSFHKFAIIHETCCHIHLYQNYVKLAHLEPFCLQVMSGSIGYIMFTSNNRMYTTKIIGFDQYFPVLSLTS